MPDYSKGMIYKIVALNAENKDDIYIGSTIRPLSERFAGHHAQYKLWKKGMHHLTSSFKLFDYYGIENCSIVLIESYPCNTIYELKAKEKYHILNNKCVNMIVPNRTREEHYVDNRETLLQKSKENYIENKERKLQYQREYEEKNKDKTSETKRKYREKNKMKETCICGSVCIKYNYSTHTKTKKHQKFINTIGFI